MDFEGVDRAQVERGDSFIGEEMVNSLLRILRLKSWVPVPEEVTLHRPDCEGLASALKTLPSAGQFARWGDLDVRFGPRRQIVAQPTRVDGIDEPQRWEFRGYLYPSSAPTRSECALVGKVGMALLPRALFSIFAVIAIIAACIASVSLVIELADDSRVTTGTYFMLGWSALVLVGTAVTARRWKVKFPSSWVTAKSKLEKHAATEA